jgi:hypothetical protein
MDAVAEPGLANEQQAAVTGWRLWAHGE